ncbi:MAG: DUF5652 family protein [Patescibacteria group bacterium]|jgi:methionyl-tRNA synthetase
MDFSSFVSTAPNITGAQGFALGFIVLWSVVWKGLALWRAARRNEPGWFVPLLAINTVGIFEIIYYFCIAKSDKKK